MVPSLISSISTSLHVPPDPENYSLDFNTIFQLQYDSILVGDFNAHHTSWYSSTSCRRAAERGDRITDALSSSPLFLLNEDSPTRLPKAGLPTSPDLSFCSSHLATSLSWHTMTTLKSDHIPIIISLPNPDSKPPRRLKSFLSFRRANWDLFPAGN